MRVSFTLSRIGTVLVFACLLAGSWAPVRSEAATLESAACPFDFTQQAAVSVQYTEAANTAIPGMSYEVRARIVNGTDQGITSGQLGVRVVRVNTDAAEGQEVAAGTLVASYIAATDLQVPAQGSTDVEFAWKLPVGTPNGTYALLTAVLGSSGLPLSLITDYGEGATSQKQFQVAGSVPVASQLRIDRSGVTVAGSVVPADRSPVELANDTVVIKVPIINGSGSDEVVGLSWRLRRLGDFHSNAVSDATGEPVTVPANGSATATYTLPAPKVGGGSYEAWITGVAGSEAATLPFAVSNYQGVRFTYAEVREGSFTGCLIPDGTPVSVSGGSVAVVVNDASDRVLREALITGDVPTAGAVLTVALPKWVQTRASIHAAVSVNGVRSDRRVVSISCGTAGVGCLAPSLARLQSWVALLAVLVFIVIITVGIFYARRKR